MRYRHFFLLFTLPLLSFALAWQLMAERPADADIWVNVPLEVNLFAARHFSGGSDYERYDLAKDMLWRECGNIAPPVKNPPKPRELEGDQVFPNDPNLTLLERRVENIDERSMIASKRRAAAVIENVHQANTRLPLPGHFSR